MTGTPSIGQLIYGQITTQTGCSIATTLFQTITGSISGSTLTLSSTPSSSIVGYNITGTNVISETYVVGGSGTIYAINISQTVVSTSLNINRSVLTLGASNNAVGIGQLVSGTGVLANTHIITNISQTTWVLDLYQTVASTTMTFSIPPNTTISAGSSSPYTITNNLTTLGTTSLLNTLNIPTSQTINFYSLPSTGSLHSITYGTTTYRNYQVINPNANTLGIFNMFQITNLPIGLYQLY